MGTWYFKTETETDIEIRENMLDYLIEILQDAVDFSFSAAKGAHYVLVHRLGEGLANWRDIQSIHKVQERYAQTNCAKQKRNFKYEQNRNLKPAPCFKYNRPQGCNEKSDHPFKNMLLRHMCQNCFDNFGSVEMHSKKNCPRFQTYQTKNGQGLLQ